MLFCAFIKLCFLLRKLKNPNTKVLKPGKFIPHIYAQLRVTSPNFAKLRVHFWYKFPGSINFGTIFPKN